MIELREGDRLGVYRVRKFLGRGGFARVYEAKGPDGRRVALKLGDAVGGGKHVLRCEEATSERSPHWLSPDETPGEAVLFRRDGAEISFLDRHTVDEQLRTEGALLGQTHHASLVGVREVFEVEGRPVLAMEYLRGVTLRETIRSLGGIRLHGFLSIVRGLRKLRDSGALPYHGDLKPENILVKPSGSMVMIDPAMRDASGRIVSTTPYYNPLLLSSSKADVMGIGVMLYEILTGTLPFDEVPWEYAGRATGNDIESLSLSYFLSYPPPRALNPNTPEALERIAYRALTVMEYGLEALESDLVDFLCSQD